MPRTARARVPGGVDAYDPGVPAELTCGVVVPSYRRPEVLRQCLDALLDQELPPQEIVVVAHIDDTDTHAVVADAQRRAETVALVTVDRPGTVHALETGTHHARADVVAFTDDDARPHRDWVRRLRATFIGDAAIAGVGGRDVHVGAPNGDVADKQTVGRLAWFGRLTGNHHVGVGPPRDVHVLKGVNCAYRRSVLEEVAYDQRLHGQGGHHHELALGLAIVRRGGRLVYDPEIRVDHEEAPRTDAPRVGVCDVQDRDMANAAFNEALSLNEHLSGARRLVYRVWSELVGHRDSPGLLQAIRFTTTLGRTSWSRWRAAGRARREARRAAGAPR